MIFKSKKIYFALAVAAILAASQAFADTVHVAKKGETIYGIAHLYNISPAALLKANPQAEKGIKKGMTLNIPDQTQSPQSNQSSLSNQSIKTSESNKTIESNLSNQSNKSTQSPTQSLTYLASDGDTFDKISGKTGVEAGTLMELNPFLDPNDIPAGTMVRLHPNAPYFEEIMDEKKPIDDNPFTVPELPDPIVPDEIEDTIENPFETAEDSLQAVHKNILVMLPFMAQSEEQNKKAQLYTDFYRGFLIAANNKVNNGMQDVEIMVVDTENDPAKTKDNLINLIDRDLAVIIAPEEADLIREIADSAATRGVYVLNIFNFTDETYKTNPYVIQGNIVQSLMYDKAIDAVMDEYPGYVPVILSPANAKDEKKAFVEALRQRYEQQDLGVMEIEFDEVLEASHLAALDPEKKYVFIPRTGSQQVFNRYAPAILELMNKDDGNGRIELFGYPDWTAYRGESLELLQRLGAKVYSRFACDEKDMDNQEVQNAFLSWYGNPMMEAVPSQGLLGYDVANFLLDALQNDRFEQQLSSPIPYRGVQSTFKFRRDNPNGGLLNENLYLIKFLPGDHYSTKAL